MARRRINADLARRCSDRGHRHRRARSLAGCGPVVRSTARVPDRPGLQPGHGVVDGGRGFVRRRVDDQCGGPGARHRPVRLGVVPDPDPAAGVGGGLRAAAATGVRGSGQPPDRRVAGAGPGCPDGGVDAHVQCAGGRRLPEAAGRRGVAVRLRAGGGPVRGAAAVPRDRVRARLRLPVQCADPRAGRDRILPARDGPGQGRRSAVGSAAGAGAAHRRRRSVGAAGRGPDLAGRGSGLHLVRVRPGPGAAAAGSRARPDDRADRPGVGELPQAGQGVRAHRRGPAGGLPVGAW